MSSSNDLNLGYQLKIKPLESSYSLKFSSIVIICFFSLLEDSFLFYSNILRKMEEINETTKFDNLKSILN